jgi:molecular chaperone DnaK (HSP70)
VAGRIGIDFGTSNSVVARWDARLKEGVPLALPEYSIKTAGEGTVPVVPSLIHYAEGDRIWIGDQVLHRNLAGDTTRTFRWMKRYVGLQNPQSRTIDARSVSMFDAAGDFLNAVMAAVRSEIDMGDEEVAVTVPVEAFEHYEQWLGDTVSLGGFDRYRLIDEASAAALGYGAHIQPGDVYLMFDFGGGTLDVAVVIIEEADRAIAGRRCRVLGKAGQDIGGSKIDGWLFEEALRKLGLAAHDESVRRVSGLLLLDCERAKIALSEHQEAEVSLFDPDSGAVRVAGFTRGEFEDLLEQRELFRLAHHTIQRALKAAAERGYTEESVKSVLMLGGSSLIPSVQTAVARLYGRDRVLLDRPLDAVARGAAAFVAGVAFYDHIQHD